MSMSHHGGPQDRRNPEQEKIIQRLMDQLDGRARREYSRGRVGLNDEGDLAFAIVADQNHKRVIVDFGKSVSWLGMTPEQAVALAEKLIEKARAVSDKPLTVNL